MKIFLSYATKDHHYKDEIKKTLSKLERDGKIKLWIDEQNLRGGEIFDETIEKEIHSSYIFLLLLSRDFWASDYIQEQELPIILERHREENITVIPIVLKDTYDLTGYDEVKNIGAMPREITGDKRLKPISEFQPEYRAYNVILEEIKKILSSLDINTIPMIQLSLYSLKTLNPYSDLEKIKLKKISHEEHKFHI